MDEVARRATRRLGDRVTDGRDVETYWWGSGLALTHLEHFKNTLVLPIAGHNTHKQTQVPTLHTCAATHVPLHNERALHGVQDKHS